MEKTTTIGFDVANQIFQVHGISGDGKVTVKRHLRRSEVLRFFADVPCRVGLKLAVVLTSVLNGERSGR